MITTESHCTKAALRKHMLCGQMLNLINWKLDMVDHETGKNKIRLKSHLLRQLSVHLSNSISQSNYFFMVWQFIVDLHSQIKEHVCSCLRSARATKKPAIVI